MQFFLENLLSQKPDQQQMLAAIGEVCKDLDCFTAVTLFSSDIYMSFGLLSSFCLRKHPLRPWKAKEFKNY